MLKVLAFLAIAIICCIVALFIYVIVQSTVYATCNILERKQVQYELDLMIESLKEAEYDENIEVDFGHGRKCLLKKVKNEDVL